MSNCPRCGAETTGKRPLCNSCAAHFRCLKKTRYMGAEILARGRERSRLKGRSRKPVTLAGKPPDGGHSV